MNIKDKITKGWNARRVMYLAFGCIAVVQAFLTQQYLLILFGGYFASMGLFGFGCAGGNCNYTPPQVLDKKNQTAEKS